MTGDNRGHHSENDNSNDIFQQDDNRKAETTLYTGNAGRHIETTFSSQKIFIHVVI